MSTEYQVHLSKSEEGMDYHIFKKPIKSKNKTIHRWYYYFTDPCTGKTVQKLVGHTSMAMTEYYTRAAIPEMVEAMQGAIPAVNGLFE